MVESPENERPDDGLDRRSVLKYGGAGALGAGLAGCQSPENPAPGGQLRVDEEPDDEEGASPDVDEDDESLLLAGETVTVGVLAPMELPVGQSMWEAAQLAAAEYNEADGMLGAEVNLALRDTNVDPQGAREGYQELVLEEDCDFTVGIFLGGALFAVMQDIRSLETIHMVTGSAEPRPGRLVSTQDGSITGQDPQEEYEQFKYYFRVGPLHLLDLADAMVEFLEAYQDEYGWERAALLTENVGEFNPYVERLEEQIQGVIDVPYSARPSGGDYSPEYNEMEGEDVDVALTGLALAGAAAINQWANQEREFEFGGIIVPAQEFDFWEGTDGNCEHTFTMNAMTPQTDNTPETQRFMQAYADMHDNVPFYTGPLTYDAFNVIAQSLERTMREEGIEGELPDHDTMIPYMEEMTYTGGTIIEEFQFTPRDAEYAHEPQFTSMFELGVPVFQQWQLDPEVREGYGTMHSIAPPQNQTSERTAPEWL